MKTAYDKLASQVRSMSAKFSAPQKKQDVEKVLSVLARECENRQVQSQRIMVLMRMILNLQPGSTRAVNEFLRHPEVANKMHQTGFTLQ